MICPFCNANDDKVIDSRPTEGGAVIRRRRVCLKCDRRFSTYERVEQSARLMVVKRDGSRVPFSSDNIIRGVSNACGKRPIPEDIKRQLAEQVEEELHTEFEREVPSELIGERVMAELREVDHVAYVRFASVYRSFKDLDDFMVQLKELLAEHAHGNDAASADLAAARFGDSVSGP